MVSTGGGLLVSSQTDQTNENAPSHAYTVERAFSLNGLKSDLASGYLPNAFAAT
jgi:hypothetical protein